MENFDHLDLADEYIPRRVKQWFGLGTAGNLALSNLMYGSITYFYNTKVGLSGNLLGLGWLIFGIWNAFNDPLFGWLTDNTRSSKGRRVPYLRYGSIFYGILFVLCWYPTFTQDDQTALFWNFLIIMIAFDTFFTMLSTVYFCLPAEMADTAEQRSSLSWYGTSFSMGAIALQLIVPAVLLTGARGENINTYFRPVMILLAILCSALICISSYYIREKETSQDQETEPFIAGLKLTLKNKDFLYFESANFSVTLLTWLLMTGIFYYIDYVVDIDFGIFGDHWWLFPLVIICCIGIGLFIRYELDTIQEKGPRHFLIRALFVLGCGFGLLFFVGRSFAGSIWAFLLIGLGYIMATITVGSLMGDIIDYDEIQTGNRREGAYAGLNAIITKPAISIANWAFLGIIESFGFLRPETSGGISTKFAQSDQAITGILFSLGLLPAIFAFLAIIGMLRYKLYGEEWNKKKIELDELHIKKERDYMMNLMKKEMLDFDPDLFSDL